MVAVAMSSGREAHTRLPVRSVTRPNAAHQTYVPMAYSNHCKRFIITEVPSSGDGTWCDQLTRCCPINLLVACGRAFFYQSAESIANMSDSMHIVLQVPGWKVVRTIALQPKPDLGPHHPCRCRASSSSTIAKQWIRPTHAIRHAIESRLAIWFHHLVEGMKRGDQCGRIDEN